MADKRETLSPLNRQNGTRRIYFNAIIYAIFLVNEFAASFIIVNNLSVPINPTLINYYRNAEASRFYRIMKNKSVTFLQIEK